MVTQHLLRPSSLQEALDKEHEANQVSQRALSVDKQLVGPSWQCMQSNLQWQHVDLAVFVRVVHGT